jgi:hypothetical protein
MASFERQYSRISDPEIWACNGTDTQLLSRWELDRQVQLKLSHIMSWGIFLCPLVML